MTTMTTTEITVTDKKGRKVALRRLADAWEMAPQGRLQAIIVLRDDRNATVDLTEDGVTLSWLNWGTPNSRQFFFTDPADAVHVEVWKADADKWAERAERERKEQEVTRQQELAEQQAADAERQRRERPWLALIGDAPRWQYLTVNTGMFNSADRMAAVFAEVGEAGWELVNAYDKASNWFNGMEKGFLLFKRPVPQGVEPAEWSFTYRG